MLKVFRSLLAGRRHCRHYEFTISSSIMSEASIFEGNSDRFSGITVDATNINLDGIEFENRLKDSLNLWKEINKRGIWFKIPLSNAVYVPVLAKYGFHYHHAKTDYVMMIKWLPNEPNMFPPFPHTSIGVAGLVVNDKNEVLVIQEKYHLQKQWKFPGGYSNPGEHFADTARREVLEETGVETEFKSVVAFRHHHKHVFDFSDLHIVCLMKPKTSEITACPKEISDCRWMALEEFKNHPDVFSLNFMYVEAMEESQKRGVELGITEYFSSITKEFQKIYHLKQNTQEIKDQ